MDSPLVSRDDILTAIMEALEPLDFVHAMWLGGAVSFNREDEWSDIEMQISVDDDRGSDAFPIVEQALTSLSTII